MQALQLGQAYNIYRLLLCLQFSHFLEDVSGQQRVGGQAQERQDDERERVLTGGAGAGGVGGLAHQADLPGGAVPAAHQADE